MPCSRIQRRRACATSARFCSAARRTFFERDLVSLKETPYRSAAAQNLAPAHHGNHLVQRQVRLRLNQGQQKLRVLLQWRGAPATRIGGTTPGLAKALHPDHRRAGTDLIMFGRLPPRSPAFHPRNHARPHVRRIGPWHRSRSQKRINADRLPHQPGQVNPLDSIRPEHAHS